MMRFNTIHRMADDGAGGPVWARKQNRSRGGAGLVGLVVTILALFGAVTIVLGIKEQSLAKGGAMMDGWITTVVDGAKELVGQAPDAADKAARSAAEVAEKTGDAVEAGAGKTVEELTKP